MEQRWSIFGQEEEEKSNKRGWLEDEVQRKINADSDKKCKKYLENGKIVIVKNGKKFNVSGLKEQTFGLL